jgi:eukaryotic-like serine/threonine-protein kinase
MLTTLGWLSVYEVGLWNGTYFIAMEFIDGKNVAEILGHAVEREEAMPPVVIANIIRDAALGLQHAHEAKDPKGAPLNVVHRDISPQNIMVRRDGVTKVVDFGIARAANRSSRTKTGNVKGKLAYMAPEQLRAETVNGKADQFALGVVLWEMLTEKRLFTADTDHELMRKVLSLPIPHPRTLLGGVPEELGNIALKMTQREEPNRYASMGEVVRELSGFLNKHSPASSESPVKLYMERVTREMARAVAGQATPSGANFVLQLKEPTAASVPVSVGETREAVVAALPRRTSMVGVGLATLAGALLAGGLLVGLKSKPKPEVEPPPVAGVPVEKVPEPALPPDEVKPVEPVVARTPGKLVLTTDPPGATVRFDGRPFTSPAELEGAAGSHVFMIEKAGFKRVEFEHVFEAGAEMKKDIKLEKVAGPTVRTAPTPSGPAVKGSGFLTINTEPWSRVMLNGAVLDSTPIYQREVPAGRLTLTLINDDKGIKTTRVVDITPGKTTKVFYELKPR